MRGRTSWSGDLPRHPISGPRSLLLRQVQGDGGTDEVLERGLVKLVPLVEVDGAVGVALKARVEKSRRVHQESAPGESQLHVVLVCLTGADDPVVRPDRNSRWIGGLPPLHFLGDSWVCFLDELADTTKGFPAPVTEFRDSHADQLRG